mmetsp:Transcript_8501/g.18077  ORF Transcript_8501/g.18077 Transcript_8501/m.18077 type:complete len:228 (+) Transcript_8501:535-1218(+)
MLLGAAATPLSESPPRSCGVRGLRGDQQGAVGLDTRGLHRSVLVIRQILLQPLQVSEGYESSLLRTVLELGERVVVHGDHALIRACGGLEIHKGVADVALGAPVDRQVDEVVLRFEAETVQLLDEHVALVLVGDVADHQSRELLTLRPLLNDSVRQFLAEVKVLRHVPVAQLARAPPRFVPVPLLHGGASTTHVIVSLRPAVMVCGLDEEVALGLQARVPGRFAPSR